MTTVQETPVLEREKRKGKTELQAFYDRETEKIIEILKQSEAVKIIRYGSTAYGTPHPDSDIDLCVLVEKREGRPKFRVVQSLYKLLSAHKYRYPVDVEFRVYSVDEFETLLKHEDFFMREIVRGEVLYERHR